MSLLKNQKPEIFNNFYFVDTAYAAISKEKMRDFLGHHRCTLLPVPGPLTLQQMLPEIIEPGTPTKRAVFAPHDWDLYASYANVSQDDPLWLSARGRPGLITASTLADFLLLHSDNCAATLHVPSFMTRSMGESKCWSDHLTRLHCPSLPSAPLDSLMGAIFTTHGKEHENNANLHFFHDHPNLKYRDQGVTYVSPAILSRAGLTNQITGKPILELPFLLGASPDGLFDVIEPTGDPEIDAGGCVEWKAAKNVKLEFKGTPFHHLAARHEHNLYPYNEIKSYYVPQSQDQLLACEKKVAFWGCWTLGGGMRVWKIRRSTEYLNLMLTVLIHLYETFVLNNQVVPDDYFYPGGPAPDNARAVHFRLVKLTAEIINMRRPDIAELYKDYDPVQTTSVAAKALLGDSNKYVLQHIAPNLARFPDFPPWLPAYAAVAMCGFAYTPERPAWLTAPTNVTQRLRNLSLLFAHIPELGFLGPIMDKIRAGSAADRAEGFEQHENFQMMRTDRMERLVILALTTMIKPTGERPSIRELAKMSNAIPGGVDRIFGLTPCNQMFLAIRDVKNPGIELEIGLKYYNKIKPNINLMSNTDKTVNTEHFNVDALHSRIFSGVGDTRDIFPSPVTQSVGLKREAVEHQPGGAEKKTKKDHAEEFDDDDDDSEDGVISIPNVSISPRPSKGMLSPAVTSMRILAPDSIPGTQLVEVNTSMKTGDDLYFWSAKVSGSSIEEIHRTFQTKENSTPFDMVDGLAAILKQKISETGVGGKIEITLENKGPEKVDETL